MPPEVLGVALEDMSHVVHLNVEDLDIDLVERNGPQDLKNMTKFISLSGGWVERSCGVL